MIDKKKFFMPAEWESHEGTLITWPSNIDTWKKDIKKAQKEMAYLASVISKHETLYISINKSDNKNKIRNLIKKNKADLSNIIFIDIPNNDCWVRDYGPNYVYELKNNVPSSTLYINNWDYNSWGGKYPPWDNDQSFTNKFALFTKCKNIINHDMILEGGSIDVNGEGLLLTTKSCLLNKNRNSNLSKANIEKNLKQYLGIKHIIWLNSGIEGDDTDGHIDDFARFINKNTIVCAFEKNKKDKNYPPLYKNYELLKTHPILKKNKIKVIKIPMPSPKIHNNIRLPASYANFYFVNNALLIPSFNDPMDDIALKIFKKLRPDLNVIQIPSNNLIIGLGGIHCLTQQQVSHLGL